MRFNLSDWAVRHRALMLFLLLAVAAAGAAAFLRLGRSEDPNFTIKTAVVTAEWPGATADEMARLVAEPIERLVQELPWFDNIRTSARPGGVTLEVNFRDNAPPRQVPQFFTLLRRKIEDVRPQLPAGVQGPRVNDEFGDVDVLLWALTGEGATNADLRRQADALKRALLRVPGVAKVRLYGVQEERIWVELDPARLATLGVSPQQVVDALARQNAVVPAGSVEGAGPRVSVRVDGALVDERSVTEVPVRAGGRLFRLGDVATVTRGYEDPPRFLARHGGQEAVMVGAVMQTGGDVLALGRNAGSAVAAFEANMPVGFRLERVADQPAVVADAVWEFERVFLEALAIVMAVTFLALGWRSGVVVALCVPLVLAATFAAMAFLGISLHRISLGALIIALGLLVDDAIIAVEAMAVKVEQGWDRVQAASYAWSTTAFPMLTGTLVMAAGFIPVGFADSATAEFTGSIFWVVAAALLVSWVAAVTAVPLLGVWLLPGRPAGRHGQAGHGHAGHGHPGHAHGEGRLLRGLRAAVRVCVRWRLTVVLATVVVFALSAFAFTRVPQQFFPLSERTELFLQLRLPQGSGSTATLEAVRQGEALLAHDPDVTAYTSYVGAGPPRFWLGLNPTLPDPAYAETVILTPGIEARERVKARLEAAAREGAIPAARVRVDRFFFGPPVGFPVQFRVIGPEGPGLRERAQAVRDLMARDPDLIEPQLDRQERVARVRLVLDQDRVRAIDADPQAVADALVLHLSGLRATVVRDGTQQVGVTLRATPEARAALGSLEDLPVPTAGGVPVALGQIARVTWDFEDAVLARRNREPVVTARADVADGVQAADVSARLWPAVQEMAAGWGPSYRVEMGGTLEESVKGQNAINAMMPVMLAAMLLVLMVQVQGFSQLALVLVTAPLGVVGAAAGLHLTGAPFGFVALLGLIALAGMIMRNTVIVVDQIGRDHAAGVPMAEAIVDATVRRARPVVLTALAAVLAMVPISHSAFWGPMAITIGAGLLGATALTLLFLPALYALWHRRRIRAEEEAIEPRRPVVERAALAKTA